MRFSSLKFSHLAFLAACALSGIFSAAEASPRSLVTARDDFDTRHMTGHGSPASSRSVFPGLGSLGSADNGGSSFSFDQPSRFYMEQSYSVSAMSGPQGSASSGLYLNTLNYRFTPLMTAFVDVGFHTPIHSSMPGLTQNSGAGELVLPRMGLEYRPNDRLTFNLEMVNGADAYKAWGGSPFGSASGSSFSRSHTGSRIP